MSLADIGVTYILYKGSQTLSLSKNIILHAFLEKKCFWSFAYERYGNNDTKKMIGGSTMCNVNLH